MMMGVVKSDHSKTWFDFEVKSDPLLIVKYRNSATAITNTVASRCRPSRRRPRIIAPPTPVGPCCGAPVSPMVRSAVSLT